MISVDTLKLVSIDNLRARGIKLNDNINIVPAILFKNTEKFIYGKEVFDYLYVVTWYIVNRQY